MTLSATNQSQSLQPNRRQQADKNAAETISRLQRGVLRLALAYHGRSVELDQKLKEFGMLIRSGRKLGDRQQLIDDIVNTVVSLDLDTSEPPSETPDNGNELLSNFLNQLAVPPNLRPDIETTQRILSQAGTHSDLLAHLKQTAEVLSQNLMHSPESCADAATIRMLLLEMIDRIPISKELVDRLPSLRKAVEEAEEVPEFVDAINLVATLIGDVQMELRNQLRELSIFLQSTASKLEGFDEFIQQSEQHRTASERDTKTLSSHIDQQIGEMRAGSDTIADIESMRAMINMRLENISEGLDTFVSKQAERGNEAEQAITSMSQRLRDLESQTENLRDDLEEQHNRSLLDPLTGILNRLGYNEMAHKQFARWKRYGGALSLAVIDLDLFKRINDEFGHAAGDRVLCTVATKIRELTRESDIVCRYGGEEFVLLLPETDSDAAGVMLENLRGNIEKCPFRHKNTPVNITISCGVAQFHDNDTLDEVFDSADQAMYRAKSDGRNRVRVASKI